MDKINYALESFKNIQDLIKFADQKAGAILVVIGLIYTAFVQYLENLVFSLTNPTFIGVFTFVMGIGTIVCLSFVLYYSLFKILKPRLSKNYREEDLSTFYFEHISKESKNIHTKFETITEEIMLKDILDQKIEVSNILNEKNKNLSISFVWLFFSLISSMIFILLSIQL
ncbi:Hypothetical transmembrane protein [Flavobacterium branchiophilum]|uniref:Hypothetical transmembrane protein n=1 Tax=Flavobacterium branchiophilum (strain FL-15) TaxID=1034807 RepID=G2Z1Y4_FLABF|nr:hypothetical protein [Flavobacterium branchiophilum]CCB69922.1 Hypothetical transmembrane protein [Flavobacterium branchiophilum FL-15]